MDALVQELIEVLRCGGVRDDQQRASDRASPPITDAAVDGVERDLVKRYLIEQIDQKQLDASPREAALVAEWAGQAERERLAEQNRRLGVLLDGVEEKVALLSPDGRILYCNLPGIQGLHDVIGVSRREVIGKTPAEIGIPGELIASHSFSELPALARARASFETSLRGRARETQLDAVYRPDGTVGAIGVLIRDVHTRKLTQLRLALLTKLSTLVGLRDQGDVAEALVQVPIPDLADWCVVNLIDNGRIQRSFVGHRNPSKAYLRDALMRAIPGWATHPLWQEMLTGGFQLLSEVSDELLRKLAVDEEHYRLMAQVGVRSLIVVPLALRGRISGIMTCAYTTESDRRYGRDDPPLLEEVALHAAHAFENARLMRELRSTEARFRIALAGARTALYEQDASLRYVWCYNPMAGCDLAGRTHEESFPPDDAALLTRVKRQVLDTGQTVSEELDLTLDRNERRHYRETIEPLRDQAGRIVGVIGAATDITEQQHTQRQLTEELEFRERMIGILGHDLRGPITAIMMAGDLLLRRQDLPATARAEAQRIRRASNRMKEMIDTLLDFTRARFLGKVPVLPVPADLGEITRGAVDELRAVWPDRPIEVDVHGDPHGEWDPARLSQTVCNLVSNAIAYGERGTAVRVSVEGEGRDTELKVHNDGPPIPEEQMQTLFQPFHRGAGGMPDDRSPWGIGLGLYIVDQVVRAHDGTVAVESRAGEGTTFTVHLPRAHISPGTRPAEPAL